MNTQREINDEHREADAADTSTCVVTKIVDTLEGTHERLLKLAQEMDQINNRIEAEQARLAPRSEELEELRAEAYRILTRIEKVQCVEFIQLQCLVAEALAQGSNASSIIQKLAQLGTGRSDMLGSKKLEPAWENERSDVSPWA